MVVFGRDRLDRAVPERLREHLRARADPVYILLSWFRLPYSLQPVQRFLYELCEPYLGLLAPPAAAPVRRVRPDARWSRSSRSLLAVRIVDCTARPTPLRRRRDNELHAR